MMVSKFGIWTVGAVCLLSLAAACGDGDSESARDSGRPRDASVSDAAERQEDAAISTDAGRTGDAANSSEAGQSGDAGKPSDAASSSDTGRLGDGGSLSDSGQPGDAGKPSTLAVSLGMAGDYVILAKSGISTVPSSAITGSIGVSPAAASAITGFALTNDATNVFSTAPQVTGKVYAADYAPPTAASLTTAVSDMQLAFTDAAGRAATVSELGAGSIGGMTLTPGVYKWSTALLIATDVTLSGSATDVWIFQIASDLSMSSGAKIALLGGALPKNVFWQVAGLVDLNTAAHCEGVILTQTSVTLHTGASIRGRLLAQTAVNIDMSTVTAP